jgi:hypothetical protein
MSRSGFAGFLVVMGYELVYVSSKRVEILVRSADCLLPSWAIVQ